MVEKTMNELLDANFVGTEMAIEQGRIDSIGIDGERLNLIEYKERAAKHIFRQGLMYVDQAISNPEVFAEYVFHQSGQTINTTIPPRLVLVSKEYDTYDKYAINRVNNEQEVVLKQYESFKSDKDVFLAMWNAVLPRDFTGSGIEDDLRLVRAGDEVERLKEAEADPELVKKIIEKNTNTLMDIDVIAGSLRTGYPTVGPIHTSGINNNTGGFTVIEYDSDPRFIEEALIKTSWVQNNHSKTQAQVPDTKINWGYKPTTVILANKFSLEQRLFIDSVNTDVLPYEYTLFDSEGGDKYMLLAPVVSPKDFKTYPGAKTYGIDDSIKTIENKEAKRTLAYIIGEIGDLGQDVQVRYNKSGVSIKSNSTFCYIRPSKDHINIKIKVEDGFKDRTEMTKDQKQDDQYRRFNISSRDKMPEAMALIRQAYNANKR